MSINYFVNTSIKHIPSFKEKIFNKILKMIFGKNFQFEYLNGKLVINTPLSIHCTNTISLSSDKHIILSSGRTIEQDRPGYNYGVWLNPDLDKLGRPLQTMVLTNEYGQNWNWTIEFDSNGNIILPSGWFLTTDRHNHE
jgi:hypothetical protein